MADNTVNELIWKMGVEDNSAPGLNSFRRNVDNAVNGVGGANGGGWLDRLAATARANRMEKRATGESALASALRSPGGLMDMAGDAMGIGMPLMVADSLGNALNGASKKAIELRDALKEGKITSEEMARGFATSIPVLGSFVGFFLNVRELATGEQAELDKINKSIKDQEALWQHKQKLLKENRDLLADHARIMERLNAEGTATYLGGTAGQRFAAKAQRAAGISDTEKARDKEVEAVDERHDADQKLKKALQDRDLLSREVSRLQDGREWLKRNVSATRPETDAQIKERERAESALADAKLVIAQDQEARVREKQAVRERRNPEIDKAKENARIADEADERAHQENMQQIEAEGMKARADAQAAMFRNEQLKALRNSKEAADNQINAIKARYQIEATLLQKSIDAQQKEYDRIAPMADKATKEETQARIKAMKERADALANQFQADQQAVIQEQQRSEREKRYRETDKQYDREDAKRRIRDLEYDHARNQVVAPRSTFDVTSMSAGQTGIAELFKDRDSIQKEALAVEKELRDYAKRIDDAVRDLTRTIERQNRITGAV